MKIYKESKTMKRLSKRSFKNIKGVDERLILILGMVLARGKILLSLVE